MARNEDNLTLHFAMVIATIFVILFCVSFMKDLVDPNYNIPSGIYPILTTIVGGIFGFVFKRSQ